MLELYEEAWPADRRAARGQRLRERQLALLRRLEGLAAETPQPSDLVSGWFDDATADKLVAAGMVSLGELGRRIAAGGRWYRTLPAISDKPRPSALSTTWRRCCPGNPGLAARCLH